MVESRYGNMLNHGGIMAHGVNCRGVMGAGLAKQIKNKFPKAFEKYEKKCRSTTPVELLGQCQLVEIDEGWYVANLFTQLSYGSTPGVVYADPIDVQAAFKALMITVAQMEKKPIVRVPKIGCGLGGGNWKTLKPALVELVPHYIHVIFYDA